MFARLIGPVLASLLFGASGCRAEAGPPIKIVTASERGTYFQMGRDLAQFVAEPASIDLEVLASAGSVENVRRLRDELSRTRRAPAIRWPNA